jgi:battenin
MAQTIALSSGLYPRLLGISMASLSSGLGELTFLQLTTTLPTASSSSTALGAWASGTGFAGIAGAGIWWILRGLGVKVGLGISSVRVMKQNWISLTLPVDGHLEAEHTLSCYHCSSQSPTCSSFHRSVTFKTTHSHTSPCLQATHPQQRSTLTLRPQTSQRNPTRQSG